MKYLKQTIITVLLAIIYGTAFSQQPTIVTTIDTLAGNRAFVTVQTVDSTFYVRYLMLNQPYDWITGAVASPGDLSENAHEHLIGNIDVPGQFGGCFPQDAIYNPANNTFYVYAGRKIIMIDGTTHLKTGDITISDTDRTNSKSLYYSATKKITLNQQHSKLYCVTEVGKLVIIDLLTNTIITSIDPGVPLQELIKTSVFYHQATNMAYWYVSTGSATNRIGKIDGQNNTETSNAITEYGINDICCNNAGTKLYAATVDGILEFSTSDLSNIPISFGTGKTHLSLYFAPNEILYSGTENQYNLYYYTLSPSIIEESITTTVKSIWRIEHNPTDYKLYCIGTQQTNTSGIRIIDIGTPMPAEISASTTYNFGYLLGLTYSSSNNTVYAAGQDVILSISGSTNLITQTQNTDGGFCSGLATNSSSPECIISVQNSTGNAMFFDGVLNTQGTVDIGNYIIGSCTKNMAGKLFIAATKSNFTSSLWVYNMNTKTMEQGYALPLPINVVDATCNQADNFVFVAGNDVNGVGHACVFNLTTNSFLVSPIPLHHTIKKIFSAPNQKTYVCMVDQATSQRWLYTIDENGVIESLAFQHSTACFSDIVYYSTPSLNRIFIVSSCSKSIYVFNCDNNSWINTPLTTMSHIPHSIAIDGTEGVFYAGYANGLIKKHSLDDYFNLSTHNTNYTEYYDKMVAVENTNKQYAFSDTRIIIFKDFVKQSEITTDNIYAVVYNHLNDQIYMFNTNNNERTLKIDVIDCHNDQITHSVGTGIKYTYSDGFYNGEFNNVTASALTLNGDDNGLYSNNTPYSNISEISCYTDRLGLQSGWNWLSFPRMERAGNNPFSSEGVLSNINYFPDVLLELIENSPNIKEWDGSIWSGNLNNVISSSGYKLDLEIPGENSEPKLKLYGSMLDPETEITLNPGASGNWVGYYLEDAQDPLVAIPEDVLQNVTQIKAQKWAMIHDFNNDPEWRYKGNVTPIKYGEMIVIYVNQQCTLTWNQPQNAAEEMMALQTIHYDYEEQADYLPLFVETDSNSDIQEIAVLADGEVRGAAVREAGDTLTQVSAYLEGVPSGTPLTFETWDGYKSAPAQETGYAVYNPMRKTWESRTLYYGEYAPYHVVSLKSSAAGVSSIAKAEVSCAPNPFNSETTFTVRVNETAQVSLTIRDMNGQTVATLLDSRMPEGLFRANWDGTISNGVNAGNGVYYYQLTIDGRQQASGKVVFIN